METSPVIPNIFRKLTYLLARALDVHTAEELKDKVKELEEELRKKQPNKNKINRLITWIRENAS
jgi:translation initiation factor 2B subunit (eIF-2B alpha/beta/delta family)